MLCCAKQMPSLPREHHLRPATDTRNARETFVLSSRKQEFGIEELKDGLQETYRNKGYRRETRTGLLSVPLSVLILFEAIISNLPGV